MANVRLLDSNAMPLIEAYQHYGLQVDLDHFAKLSKTLDLEMDRITEEVHREIGAYINLDSPQQVSKLLFKTLGLKQARVKMTTGGIESTGNEVLEAIKHDHPIVPKILEYRECSKINGTYVKPIPKLARRGPEGDWRLYPNFRTSRVPSGRLAAYDPNLLAIPTRSDRGKEVRKGFITKPGWKIVTVDESQIEARITAHRCNCKSLINSYLNDEDVYSDFAIQAFHLDPTKYQDSSGKWKYPSVDKEEHRFPAKTCILASIYDVSAPGLLEQMPVGKGWTENKCQDLLNSFYLKYPEILHQRKRDHATAKRHGGIWDMWGRILHTPGVRSVLPWVVSATLRELSNFPVQSAAQGTIKLVMASVYDIWEGCRMQEVVHPLLQVHDELLFECREDVAEEWINVVGTEFENCVKLLVPIKWSGDRADSWGDISK